jgi:hypothetical protein
MTTKRSQSSLCIAKCDFWRLKSCLEFLAATRPDLVDFLLEIFNDGLLMHEGSSFRRSRPAGRAGDSWRNHPVSQPWRLVIFRQPLIAVRLHRLKIQSIDQIIRAPSHPTVRSGVYFALKPAHFRLTQRIQNWALQIRLRFRYPQDQCSG